jgi:AcrR family transcriptional regulator
MTVHTFKGSNPTSGRRTAILEAALAEFNAHGVAGTSIEDIRRRSGASVGSIYHHFGGKDRIAQALYLDGLRDYQDGFIAALRDSASTRDGVKAGVRHHLAWIVDHRELARFLFLGRAAGERAIAELNRRFFGAVTRWMAPAISCGELRDLTPEVLSALWIGPSQELARHWLAGRARTSLLEAAPVLADAAWKSLSLEA